MVSFEILSKCLINGNSDSLRIRTEAVSVATRVRIFLHRAMALYASTAGLLRSLSRGEVAGENLNNCVKETIKETKLSTEEVWARKLKDPWHIKR